MAEEIAMRKSVPSMGAAELDALRESYRQMMALPAEDNRGWQHWAGHHGFPGGQCWHHGRVFNGQQPMEVHLFLPWHRAYLLGIEHAMRDRVPQVALPWWDWSSTRAHQDGIPDAFAQAQIGGVDNPLAAGPVPTMDGQPARKTKRFPGPPDALPSRQQVRDALALTDFIDFSTAVEDLHDAVHGWCGGVSQSDAGTEFGDMGSVATAAYDPIFWTHHCTIDRLWYLWQLRHGLNNIPVAYLDLPLSPWSLRVRDVLDIRRLGYDYAAAHLQLPFLDFFHHQPA
ncbi:MAG TPA: tyrosinase family protein [Nannocystaceae bacterium]|nr:tyrosinase family protein [Nannocystaceae bacterium]